MADLSHLPDQWRRSGLSQRAFCNRHDISLATFAYWRAKELRAERAAERARDPITPAATIASQQAFTEVFVEPQPASDSTAAPSPTSPVIEITFPDGTHVRIPVPAIPVPASC